MTVPSFDRPVLPATDHGATWHLEHDAFGRLVLIDAAGQRHVGAHAVRAFPLSSPSRGVALVDSHGREVVWIDDLDALPPLQRQQVEADLARHQFLPVIQRVLSISSSVEPSEWQVETDRGLTRFTLKNEDDVHPLGEHTALVTDGHGIRYLIPDVRQLDTSSRGLVERFL